MSSATIVGLAALGNPQQAEGKALLFVYLGPGSSMSGALRYFNNDDLEFSDIGTYVLCANVAKIAEGAHVGSVKLDLDDYDVVGDILWLFPVTTEHARHRPWASICGVASRINSRDWTFDVNAGQYTTALKENRAASVFPVHAIFQKDSPRYKNSKAPLPTENSYVSFQGYLKRMVYPEGSQVPQHFVVDIENITFLGRPTVPLSAKDSNSSLATPVTGKRKFHFDFDSPTTPTRANTGANLHVNTTAIASPVTPTPIRVPAQNQNAEPGPGPSTLANKRRRGENAKAAQVASIPSSPLSPPPA